jgi:hypothetical protein
LGDVDDLFSEDPIYISGVPGDLAYLTAKEDATTVLTKDGRAYLIGDYDRAIILAESKQEFVDPAPPIEIEALETANTGVLDGNCAVRSGGALTCIDRFGESSISLGLPFGVSETDVSLAQERWHACSISTEGVAKCAGENEYGVLGNGEICTEDECGMEGPYVVEGLATPVIAVSTGGNHSCALSESASVYCWGFNANGQLGDGTMLTSAVPVQVVGIEGEAVDIKSIGDRSCALTAQGAVFCWGDRVFSSYDNVAGAYLTVAGQVIGFP